MVGTRAVISAVILVNIVKTLMLIQQQRHFGSTNLWQRPFCCTSSGRLSLVKPVLVVLQQYWLQDFLHISIYIPYTYIYISLRFPYIFSTFLDHSAVPDSAKNILQSPFHQNFTQFTSM